MRQGRHPFKAQPPDTRAHGIIEHYLRTFEYGHEWVMDIFPSHDAANEGRLSARRGARAYGVSCAAWVVDNSDGSARLHMRLFDKESGRDHVTRKAGGDPRNLKYNPYASRAGQ